MDASARSIRRRNTTWGPGADAGGPATATSAAHPEWDRSPSATRVRALTASESDPHAELDVARRRRGIEQPEAAPAEVQALVGEAEVRLVEDVEQVGLDLQLDVAADREPLAQRDVPDLQARPPELAALAVAAPAFRRGREHRRVEPTHVAGHRGIEALRVRQVGIPAHVVGAPGPDRAVRGDGDRRPRLIPPDAADLPAAQDAADSLLVPEERKLPGP